MASFACIFLLEQVLETYWPASVQWYYAMPFPSKTHKKPRSQNFALRCVSVRTFNLQGLLMAAVDSSQTWDCTSQASLQFYTSAVRGPAAAAAVGIGRSRERLNWEDLSVNARLMRFPSFFNLEGVDVAGVSDLSRYLAWADSNKVFVLYSTSLPPAPSIRSNAGLFFHVTRILPKIL